MAQPWWNAAANDDPLRRAMEAIAGIESGGRYGATGPRTRTGDRAYGRYQVMGANISPWAEAAGLGRMTPEQFLGNRDAQDTVFRHRFGDYMRRFGPGGAARAWFAGPGGMNDPRRRDVLGTTVGGYGRRFDAAFGAPPPPPPSIPGMGMPRSLVAGWSGGIPDWTTETTTEPPPQTEPPPTAAPPPTTSPPIATNTPPEYQGQFGSQIGLLAGLLNPTFRGTAGRMGVGGGQSTTGGIEFEPPPPPPPPTGILDGLTGENTTLPPLDTTREGIPPGREEITTERILGTPPPMPPGQAREIAHRGIQGAAGAAQAEGPGYLDRLLNNRAFLMGMGILGTPPGGNWGRSAMEATRAHREQTEHDRLTNRRSVMDRVWAEAFPNGRPNTAHPLLRDVPPEMLSTVFALGPETGLTELQRFAFARSQQDLALRLSERHLALLSGQGGAGTGQPPPTTQPPPGERPPITDLTPFTNPPDPFSGAGADIYRPSADGQLLLATQPPPTIGQPPPPAGPGRAEPMVQWLGRSVPLSEARRIAQTAAVLRRRNEPLEQAIAVAVAGQQAEETRLGTGRGEQRAGDEARTERSRQIWDMYDQLERHVTGLGESRFTAAARPSMDTFPFNWTSGSQAWNDRQEMLAYLDNIVLLGRQGTGSQTGLSDRENDQIRRAVTAAREASTPAAFMRQIEIVRGILATNIPERRGYQPRLDRTPPAAGAAGTTGETRRDLQPPASGPGVRATDRFTPDMEGSRVYDSQTGRWGHVINGRFVPGFARALPSFMYGR